MFYNAVGVRSGTLPKRTGISISLCFAVEMTGGNMEVTMNKKISLGAAIAFMAVVAGITFCITMMVSLDHFNTMVLDVKVREEQYKKIQNVDHEVRQNYDGTIDEELLQDSISSGFIKGLNDPYSGYIAKSEYEEIKAELEGQRASIGLTIDKDASGYMVVTKVADASPAAEEGIAVGDLLTVIDGQDLKVMTQAGADRLLRGGAAGTKVTITYQRDGTPKEVELARADLQISYVDSRMIGNIGYLQITEFNAKTPNQFRTAIDALMKQGAVGLIFDVRNNASASVKLNTADTIDAANRMLDILLPSGNLGSIVKSDGTVSSVATSDRESVNLPMTVLINGKSGCAAEYFAAAIKEFEKGNLIGTQTMGKNSLQELRPLTDGSAIYLTVAHFLTSADTDIANVGIKPDYEIQLSAEQERDFALLTDDTDPQIKKALEVVNSKVIIDPVEDSQPESDTDSSTAE